MEASHKAYLNDTVQLVRLAMRRGHVRERCWHQFDEPEKREEELHKEQEELDSLESDITSLIERMRECEENLDELGMHILERQAGRQLDDAEYTLVWLLFWSSCNTMVDSCGRDLLYFCADGGVADIIDARKIFHSDGILRASGIVVTCQNGFRRGLCDSLLGCQFSLTESVVRILAHNDSANTATFEAMRLDHAMLDADVAVPVFSGHAVL